MVTHRIENTCTELDPWSVWGQGRIPMPRSGSQRDARPSPSAPTERKGCTVSGDHRLGRRRRERGEQAGPVAGIGGKPVDLHSHIVGSAVRVVSAFESTSGRIAVVDQGQPESRDVEQLPIDGVYREDQLFFGRQEAFPASIVLMTGKPAEAAKGGSWRTLIQNSRRTDAIALAFEPIMTYSVCFLASVVDVSANHQSSMLGSSRGVTRQGRARAVQVSGRIKRPAGLKESWVQNRLKWYGED